MSTLVWRSTAESYNGLKAGTGQTATNVADSWDSMQRPRRESTSGVYLLPALNSREPAAVFKPKDEEICRGSGRVLADFARGSGAVREVAAYELDREGFVGVSETRMVKLSAGGLVKEGMLQAFVENVGDSEDYGPSLFGVENVQRIASFDIRIMNADRHAGNLLVSKTDGEYKLHPIDHGLSMPDNVRTLPWPVWMDWEQVKQPMTADVKEHIMNLDPHSDAKLLRSKFGNAISDGAVDALICGTVLLQVGASLGLSLFDVGKMIFSVDAETPGFMERLLTNPVVNHLADVLEQNFQVESRCSTIVELTLESSSLLAEIDANKVHDLVAQIHFKGN
uniref:PI3K/PI4K catalytic domain-containing protein n=1 Tax=Rhodosorus marinus TaxID=101924 RepID=A0A7S0BGI1_9RHOD|mmetsp:Transcript_14034/g.20389  ORF Transcript_14034/g.20389 Transcript_14034/m.20389 type:complete len:337 (+) Transcript_14034:363-1373(+)|eukprot:CAMPEP_0184739462 /NCGR_PEP_ID=MMETSP0315-20130426/2370_1 /TAXON_ID=101924 /ORGANISM="Rhodosorus marinus, Strain UTEX LB 2760" /LENGTH=336 /DNA_ID=CAMNT_0027208337 /DNA_START=209 /DNA_END=1219 /DNA_ORIENTATION=-